MVSGPERNGWADAGELGRQQMSLRPALRKQKCRVATIRVLATIFATILATPSHLRSLAAGRILQVTGAGIGAPTGSASCATEHLRIAALEAANALLNATVFAQAAEISELRWQPLGMPACT